jgi:D-alanyl-D-alanine carboxypeptidase (penicillin-binding protein 5/6)
MKHKNSRNAVLLASVLVSASWLQPSLAHAAKAPAPIPAAAASSYPAPIAPEIAAKSYLLIDVSANGQVLAAKNADQPVEPASLTKLMTAYVVFDALKNKRLTLDQKLTVSARAKTVEGSRMFVDTGWQVPVEDLLKGLIVQSGNDAANVLAEGVGGSIENFVQMMNNKAQQLGMKGTHYQNAEGLTQDGHSTTAHDLALLAQRLMQDFPEYTGYYAIKHYRYPGTPLSNDTNRNTLLFRDPSVDGLKTGHTAAAGYCLVSTAKREYAGVGARRLVSIVLGTASDTARAAESQKLLNWGFVAYQPVKLFAAGAAVSQAPIFKGNSSTVAIGLPRDVIVAVPAGTAGQVSTALARPNPLLAPVRKGQSLGSLQISIAGRPYTQLPMQALQDVPQAGWFGRSWDAVRLWIQ